MPQKFLRRSLFSFRSSRCATSSGRFCRSPWAAPGSLIRDTCCSIQLACAVCLPLTLSANHEHSVDFCYPGNSGDRDWGRLGNAKPTGIDADRITRDRVWRRPVKMGFNFSWLIAPQETNAWRNPAGIDWRGGRDLAEPSLARLLRHFFVISNRFPHCDGRRRASLHLR